MGWFLRLKRPPCQEHRCKQVLCGRVKRRTQRDLKVPGERRKPLRGDLFSTPHRYTTIGMASAILLGGKQLFLSKVAPSDESPLSGLEIYLFPIISDGVI